MLSRLNLKNWKSFEDASASFGPLTLVVGANGSGKSNLLDAIELLRGMALGYLPADLFRSQHELRQFGWKGIRGGAQEAARVGTTRFELSSEWTVDEGSALHHVEMNVETAPTLVQESFRVPLTLHTWQNVGVHQSVLWALANDPGTAEFATAHHVARAIARVFPLQLVPSAMGDYVSKHTDSLTPDGSSVAAILFGLCRDQQQKADLLDWLSELCAPRVIDIEFVETSLGDVTFQLVEEGGRYISARSLSAGTLRFLGMLVALLWAPPNTTLVMEEIEDGLHPSRVRLLVELLSRLTERRGLQVIATTHSPLVLEALGEIAPSALRQALVCGRTPEAAGTLVRSLTELPHFDEVLARRGIDQLFSTQWLERAL